MLPKLSGLQVLRHLRAETDIPILILSARGEEQDRIDGLELGADDYVVKPFALRELLARVRAGVRRRAVPAAQPAVLFRGPLRIELERHRVLVGEERFSCGRRIWPPGDPGYGTGQGLRPSGSA